MHRVRALGSTYLAIAIVVSGAPPLLSAGSRFFAGGLILAAIVGFRNGWRTLRVTRRELGGAALIGILLLGIGSGGVSLAERYVPSSSSALVIASVPLWLICLRTATKDRPAALTWAGVVCGFLGVGLLVAELGRDDPAPGDGYINLPGWQVALWLGVIVVGSITWAIGSFISPRLVAAERAPRNPMVLAAWQFLIAGVLLMVVGVGRGEDATAMAHLEPEDSCCVAAARRHRRYRVQQLHVAAAERPDLVDVDVRVCQSAGGDAARVVAVV